ncbi:hypothetical protein [Thermococcus sp. GR4]|uniref:hypothetical protein n=1 Tax=Thermococcus sp. GR4 TaxID=1638254 RepID=UPI001432094F|nr:hypothetical protein [Thermococcus sp. GR4]NJE79465.1 hypothetical protein [Thermococcus sp. GR4]
MKNKMFLLTIFYFLLFSISWLVFWNRPEFYVRPKIYFAILSIMGIIILIQVLVSPKEISRFHGLLIFFEIFLLSISFNLTQQLLYKTVTGRDPWGHWVLTKMVLTTGHIPSFKELPTPYVRMPNLHLLIGAYMLISETAYKWGSYLVAGVGTLILETIVMYSLAKVLFDDKIALLSTLFVAVSDNVLYMTGRNIVPNTTGVGIALLLLYLFLQRKNLLSHINGKSVVIILAVGLVFMHTISYSFVLIQLVLLISVNIIYQKAKREAYEDALWIVTFLAVAVLEWMYFSGIYFVDAITRIYMLFIVGVEGISEYQQKSLIPLTKVLLARAGMLSLFAISGVGILIVLIKSYVNSREYRPQIKLAIVSVFFIVIGMIAPLIPTFLGINERFWYYGEILGSVYAGYLVLQAWQSKKFRSMKRPLVVFSAFVLIWLMFVASISNDDNPLVKEYTIRTGWYDSEILAAKFAVTKSPIPLASDIDFQHFGSVKVGMLGENFKTVPMCNLKTFDDILQSSNCLVLIRIELIQERYFVLGKGYSQRAYLPLGEKVNTIKKILHIGKSAVVYDNHYVMGVI